MIVKDIKFELLSNFKGVLQNQDSVFCDLKTDAMLSFLLPERYKEQHLNYVIGIKHNDLAIDETHELVGMQFLIPRYLFKQGVLLITIYAVAKGQIVHKWDCEPLIITNFSEKAKTIFEFCPDISVLADEYRKTIKQVAEFKETIAEQQIAIKEFESYKQTTATELLKTQQAVTQLQQRLDGVIEELNV